MEIPAGRILLRLGFLILVSMLQVSAFTSLAIAQKSDSKPNATLEKKDAHGHRHLLACEECGNGKDVRITMAYTDVSGAVRMHTVKPGDLSASWVWGNSSDGNHKVSRDELVTESSSQKSESGTGETDWGSISEHRQATPISPVILKRQQLREKRRTERTILLTQQSKATENQMESAAIERAEQFDSTIRGKYSIWRREYGNPHDDSTLKLMKDQVIMAKVYASIASSKNQIALRDSLMKRIKASQHAIGEARSDAELGQGALERAKAMGSVLLTAKERLYDCVVVARKLRAMLQSAEENINAVKKQSTFLIQLAAKTVPKPLHCLSLRLTTDYFLLDFNMEDPEADKLEDPSLYHYAIFSDNVLATSVVINSTALHAKEPEKHVFHIVTDRLNFAAMQMWFLAHPPPLVTIQIDNIDKFKWLNSSYCSVLRQLESARIKEYYFKVNRPSTLSAGNENLKYRNPKYLSMLNHLRFYMPEVYPKLDKILFLDDDVVVQKDLTPLWSIDMRGMVNGAVETCKESFHRYDTYLNFSNPKISQNFDPRACGWAFGMNMFDLKEWKKRNITGIYHYWQDLNEDRTLWKLGSLPPGLITFYNLTYALPRIWHVLGLGYDPAIDTKQIELASVVHYNGNYKPWLDLAIAKYKKYWSKFVQFDNPYLQQCRINY